MVYSPKSIATKTKPIIKSSRRRLGLRLFSSEDISGVWVGGHSIAHPMTW